LMGLVAVGKATTTAHRVEGITLLRATSLSCLAFESAHEVNNIASSPYRWRDDDEWCNGLGTGS